MYFISGFSLVHSRVSDRVIGPSFMMAERCYHDLRCIHAETVDFTSRILTLPCDYVLNIDLFSVGGL